MDILNVEIKIIYTRNDQLYIYMENFYSCLQTKHFLSSVTHNYVQYEIKHRSVSILFKIKEKRLIKKKPLYIHTCISTIQGL